MIRVLGIASGGGHLHELKRSLKLIREKKNHEIMMISCSNGRSEAELDHGIYWISDPEQSIVKHVVNTAIALYYLIKIRPNVIISTGAGVAVPFLVCGKLFKCTVIFIESGARISALSKTGRLAYCFVDFFFVQSEQLVLKYPKAKYGLL